MLRKCLLLLALFSLVAGPISARGQQEGVSGKLEVVTTLFPLYDFSRQVGGDLVEVTLLLPPGVEAHSFEPTPRDIIRIEEGQVFVYTGRHMEPWAEDLLAGIRNEALVIVDTSRGIELMDGDEHDHDDDHDHEVDEHNHDDDDHDHEVDEHNHDEDDHDHEVDEHNHDDDDHDHETDEHDHGGVDPHIWVDPVLAGTMVETIVAAFSEADPGNRVVYEQNGKAYLAKLDRLHRDIQTMLAQCESREVIFGGHSAFGYFAHRYGLTFISAYPGFSPNTEPSSARLAGLIETIQSRDINVIYTEELLEPRVARILAEETGAEILVLHAAHNISKKEKEEGVTYLEIMYANLEKLKTGLHYMAE